MSNPTSDSAPTPARVSFWNTSPVCAGNHRRKLLLGPGAQAPPPNFMIMGLAYMTSPPHFCHVILSKLCFNNYSHWFYAMPTNRQLDHSFPAVLVIFGKGLNLPAPMDIQWLKCFLLQGALPLAPTPGALPTDTRYRLVLSSRHGAPPATDPSRRLWSSRLEPPPLILTSLCLCRRQHTLHDE